MTEAEWLTCADPTSLLQFLDGRGSERKLRLVACACCRRMWGRLVDPRSRDAVERAEAFADGLVARDTWSAVRNAAREASTSVLCSTNRGTASHAAQAAFDVTRDRASSAASHTIVSAWEAVDSLYQETVEGRDERLRQCLLFHEIFGNPFRPVATDPAWLTSTVVGLATGIYAERAFDRLPILADALQDAGCDSPDILDHCRGPAPHVLGCWVVDAILNKQ